MGWDWEMKGGGKREGEKIKRRAGYAKSVPMELAGRQVSARGPAVADDGHTGVQSVQCTCSVS